MNGPPGHTDTRTPQPAAALAGKSAGAAAGGAGNGENSRGARAAHRLGGAGRRVLELVRLVRDDGAPLDPPEVAPAVAADDLVRRDERVEADLPGALTLLEIELVVGAHL